MTRIFINREKELSILEEAFRRKKSLVVIYGRRRVGKTILIKNFLKNKDSIYFLCSKRRVEYNLKKFAEEVSRKYNLPTIQFKNFKEAFEFLADKVEIVVIDEFGYLIEKDEGILSDFQEIVDEILKNSKTLLILCGSSVGMMETEVLGYKSPLYGRADVKLKIKPLSFKFLFEWFKNMNFIDAVKLYSVTNNVPRYLEFFDGKNVEKEIIKNFFDNSSFLYNDAIYILSEELRDYSTYTQILEAIALGYVTITEIANYALIDPKDTSYYLRILSKLDIVDRKIPIFSTKKGKRGIYVIKDNYFNFWFRFVSPFQSEIESYFLKNAIENFHKNFNTYLGKVFEDLILRLIQEGKIKLPIVYTKIGKWWHKDKEIDIVALNENTKEILFCECKWQDNINAEKIAKELIEKSQYVSWYNKERKEYLTIFAKSFKKKIDVFEGRKVYCFDLKDLEKVINKL